MLTHQTPVIRSFDLVRSLEGIEQEILEAIQRVIQSGQIILGPEGRLFEQEFADYVGAAEAVGTSSGTDALILALRAVGVGQDDEVITVANTAAPTAAAIRAVGAIPRFVDVDSSTLLMNPDQVKVAVSSRTRAILPVHLYGLPVPMAPLLALARQHGLSVVEDCAHAHGAFERGTHVGIQGDVGCFSFYPTKNMGALGDAGICVTRDAEIAGRIRSLRMYGFNEERISMCDGLNSRMDEVQAAVLRLRLSQLSKSVTRRQEIAAYYLHELSDLPVVLPAQFAERNSAWHQFVIRVRHRNHVIRVLNAYGIDAGIHYQHPLHRMPAFAPWFPSGQRLPITEQAAEEILSLPIAPELRNDECARVVFAVRAAIQGGTL
jgi:dTDP-4-amino-4,6-dideoxygalactose transaminase